MTRRSVTASAIILASSSIFSYLLGLLRDRLLASHFGAGSALDIFNSAFLIPDLINNLFAAALTTAFIPVLTSAFTKQGETAGWAILNRALQLLSTTILVSCGLAWLFMPWLVHGIAPGFSETERATLLVAARWMLLSPVLLSLSTVFGSGLQTKQRFISYALSPVLYNLGIVIGIIFLAPSYGIIGVVWGVGLGAGLHMLARLIELIFSGWKVSPPSSYQSILKDPDIRHTIALMLPRVVGLVAVQANLWVYNAMASGLDTGSIAVFNFARNFQSLPVSLFGIALATALFPKLAQHFAEAKHEQLQSDSQRGLQQLIWLTVPAMFGMMLLAQPLIKTFLGSGKFDQAAVIATSTTLVMFALSIPFESCLHILARMFYAQHNTKTPVKIAVMASVINVVVCLIAVPYLGVVGLALGFVLTTVSQVIGLWWSLHIKMDVFGSIGRALVRSIPMVGAVALVLIFVPQAHFQLLLGSAAGAIVYVGLAKWI